jgi:hypothetical protein
VQCGVSSYLRRFYVHLPNNSPSSVFENAVSTTSLPVAVAISPQRIATETARLDVR